MTSEDALAELEACGTDKRRAVYRRHGVLGDQFGVSTADVKALAKRIGIDHALARALWASGNHDARVLATFVADQGATDAALLDAWANTLDSYVLTDAFSAFAARTRHAHTKMGEWVASEGEWTESAGWNVLAHRAVRDDALPDDLFLPYLDLIRMTIHARANRVRHAMNNALIAVGTRNDVLEARALAVADAVGTVTVDHGRTNCTTPDAAPYIRKTRARQKARAAKARAGGRTR